MTVFRAFEVPQDIQDINNLQKQTIAFVNFLIMSRMYGSSRRFLPAYPLQENQRSKTGGS